MSSNNIKRNHQKPQMPRPTNYQQSNKAGGAQGSRQNNWQAEFEPTTATPATDESASNLNDGQNVRRGGGGRGGRGGSFNYAKQQSGHQQTAPFEQFDDLGSDAKENQYQSKQPAAGDFQKPKGPKKQQSNIQENIQDETFFINGQQAKGGKGQAQQSDIRQDGSQANSGFVQTIRGKGRGFSGPSRGGAGHYAGNSGLNAQNDQVPSASYQRGRGRGRGGSSNMQVIPAPTSQEFYPSFIGEGGGRGGASFYVSSSFQDSQGQTQQQYQIYQFSQPFVPYQIVPPAPQQANTNQWVGDFQGASSIPSFRPSTTKQQVVVPDDDEEEEKVSFSQPQEQKFSSNFKPSAIPGVIHFSRQPQQSANDSRSKKDSQPQQFLQGYENKHTLGETFEEKVIQDKRNMSVSIPYKEYPKSEFFQGPQYVIFKEPSKLRNHKYPDVKDDEAPCYEIAPYPPKPKEKEAEVFRRQRKASDQNSAEKKFKASKIKQIREEKGFDIKEEKRLASKVWKEAANTEGKRQKGKGRSGKETTLTLTKRDSQKQGGKRKQAKEQRKGKNGKDDKKKKVSFEEYLQIEEELKKGIENGSFFEGLLRVNPNNRDRAFVSIEGLKVDVMIDGQSAQNRALDGDTVIIQLLNSTRWPDLTSQKIVVNHNGQPKSFTNDTPVEVRVVDVERGVEANQTPNGGPMSSPQEGKMESPKKDAILVSESDSQLGESEILKQEEERKEGEEEDDENAFDEDEVVDSDEEEGESEEEETVSKKQKKSKKEEKKVSPHQHMIFSPVGKTRKDILNEINLLAKELRPIGRVKAIMKSPNREKDHMITLTILDKERLDDETFLKMLQAHTQSSTSKSDKKNGSNVISNKVAQNSGIYAVPVSKKLPWMTISNIPQEFINDVQSGRQPKNRYYIAKFESWNVGFIRPMCKIIEHIGEAGNLNAESLRILKMNDVWCDEYESEGQKANEKVVESLKVFTKDIDVKSGEWKIPQEEISKRLDLRKKRIFTIDPITAKDLDDALSIDKISDTIYEIGVHIADVSYFVTQGTELDKEAQLRCTSVYFVHKVYPMLPRLLCERLCSLNPQVDRLSYSVIFRMDMTTGEIDKSFKPQISRSVMRSCAKWNYQLVQDILDKKITKVEQLEPQYRPQEQSFDDMVADLFLMHEIAKKRRAIRLENGSIMLQNREYLFKLDPESMMPLSFEESKIRMPSKHLVEEYMLLANILIAEHLFTYCSDKALLRAHPDLDNEKKKELALFYERVGMGKEVDLTNSKTLSQSLETLRAKGDSSRFNVAMRKFLTCLTCAKYMCINQSEPIEYQHYGLNFALYTHFTSPIRRYADLLVHRLVTLSLTHGEKTRDLIELMDYSNYADLCSEKSLAAKRASQACTRLFHCLLIKSEGQKVFDTLCFDVDHSGNLSIYIDEVNMHHKIHLRDDPRISSVIFFEEHLVLAAYIKTIRKSTDPREPVGANKAGGMSASAKLEAFKAVKSLEELTGKDTIFAPEELLILRVFDRVKVRVDTTIEFPLDIKCTLLFGKDDLDEYQQLLAEQEARQKAVTTVDSKATGSLDSSNRNQNGAASGILQISAVEAESLDAEV